jgi:hypothetical protein
MLELFQTATDWGTMVYNLVWILSFMVLFVYGSRIQIYFSLRKIGGDLRKLERMKEGAKSRLRQEISRYGMDEPTIKSQVDQLITSVMIEPVSMDPQGIVFKLNHIIRTYENYFKSKVANLTPKADRITRQNLSNLVEVGMALDYLYRYVRHLYSSAKKYNDLFAVVTLQMNLPLLMDTADAYYSSVDAFSKGDPIGDGLGPLVASRIISTNPVRLVTEETVYSETSLDDRRLIVVRAEGPGGTVGRPGEAVEKLLEIYPDVSMVVTVDAALKLEGEKSGEVAEGIGAAIGGPGVDRYLIEESATKRKVPMYAVVVKMSEKEAITKMKDEIKAASDEVLNRIRRLLADKTKPNSTVLLAGIGNTMGIR